MAFGPRRLSCPRGTREKARKMTGPEGRSEGGRAENRRGAKGTCAPLPAQRKKQGECQNLMATEGLSSAAGGSASAERGQGERHAPLASMVSDSIWGKGSPHRIRKPALANSWGGQGPARHRAWLDVPPMGLEGDFRPPASPNDRAGTERSTFLGGLKRLSSVVIPPAIPLVPRGRGDDDRGQVVTRRALARLPPGWGPGGRRRLILA